MAVSQSTAMFFLSMPPVRGFVALLFLLMVTALPAQAGELGIGSRIALCVFALLLGTAVWVYTLRGFLRDVREPRRLGEAVIVANRPRRVARLLSWSALVAVIVEGLLFGLLIGRDDPDWAFPLIVLTFPVVLAVASLLPRLSRWYADGAGVVAVAPHGMIVVPGRGEAVEMFPWARVQGNDVTADLGRRVRWSPGAQDAVQRWVKEGFAPTAAEVRQLRLEPTWSPDPEVLRPSSWARWGIIALQGWATVFCALLGGAMIWAVAVGEAQWWMFVLGWAPLLGFVILAPRVVRILRTDQRRAAEVTAAGWVDHLHGQGLVPWEHIERIEVRDRHTLVVSRADAPSFRDRDLGNRMNNWLTPRMEKWPERYRIPSAGPLFREIGPRHLPYLPETRAFQIAAEAERRGGVTVRCSSGDH